MSANGCLHRVLLTAVVFTAGCSAVDKVIAPSLSGTPATSSLVVVACEASMVGVLDLRTPQSVQFGVLHGTDGMGRFIGRPVSNLIIFSDVPPGEYQLYGVQTTWATGNMTSQTNKYVVPQSEASKFVVKTALGEPKFLGVVAVQEVRKLNEQGVKFTVSPSKEAEAQAWEKFTQVYDSHPWASAVRKRISELRP